MALNYIYIGSTTEPSFFFNNEQITSLNANIKVDALGNELSIDTLEFEVRYDDLDGTFSDLKYGTPIWYYDSENFVGKFYCKNVARIGVHLYRVESVSIIGLLEYEKHYGGFYHNISLREAIDDVFVNTGLSHVELCEYLTLGGITNPIPNPELAPGRTVSDIDLCSTQTNVELYFRFNHGDNTDSTTARILWANQYTNYGSVSEYNIGIVVTEIEMTSSQPHGYITFYVYCGTRYVSFTIAEDSWASVTINPVNGTATLIYNNTTTTKNFDATINYKYRIPLYSLHGLHYTGSTPARFPDATLKYSLGYIRFFSGSKQIKFYPFKDKYNGNVYLRPVPTTYLFYSTFIQGAAAYGVSWLSPAMSQYYPDIYNNQYNTELGIIAQNINWQDGVENVNVNGWIPSGTKREVLHQLLFAYNCNLYKDANGNLIIGKLPEIVEGTIPEEEIYNGGRVEPVKKPQKIELTEHYYETSGSSVGQVFNNTSAIVPSGAYFVEFNNAPIYDSVEAVGNIIVIGFNANAALVKGSGSINARPYSHSKRVITETISNRPDSDTVSVSNATLVTYLNSSSVMDKLKAFYANNVKRIKNSIVGSGRKTGRKFALLSPFYEDEEAYMMSARVIGSATTKYDCEFISGYTPVGVGNTYNNFVILTGSGTFEVPAGATKLYAVLIGGGSGGESGLAGEPGNNCPNFRTPQRAKGGAYGANGTAGKVYVVTINNPSASYEYSCGQGGSGGETTTSTTTHNSGEAGGDTTFGSYSSASGSVMANGYTNILDGAVYAKQMPPWNDRSGKGGDGGYAKLGNYSQSENIRAEDAYNFLSGADNSGGGGGLIIRWLNGDGESISRVYGLGGGAALDENGKPALYFDPSDRAVHNQYPGGDGADATYVPPKPTEYNATYFGYGGMGGAGGGAGGMGGGWQDGYGGEITLYPGGDGGYGGQGGDGGDGCVVVFY